MKLAAAMIALAALLWASSGKACTDGFDCRCDVLLQDYPDMAFCEDFENDRLQEPCGWQGGGGCGSSAPYGGWDDQSYGGITGSCQSGSNPGMDITNTGRCIEITERGVASSTDIEQVPLADIAWDGNHSMAQVNRPSPGNNQTGGIHGTASLTGAPLSDFSYTMAIYYSDSIEEQGAAWKADEFTGGRWSIGGSSTGQAGGGITSKIPYSARIWDTSNLPLNYTVNKGTAALNPNGSGGFTGRLKASAEFGSGPGQYEYQKGIWRCRQIVYTGWGTTNGNIRHYWDGELVMDIDVDMSAAGGGQGGQPNPNGMDQFEFNNYWNGSGQPQGYKGNNVSGRIKDNVVIIPGGTPVSCSEIGFGPPPPAPNVPSSPALLPPFLIALVLWADRRRRMFN